MTLSIESIAESISRHRFEEAAPYLADDISWTLIGADPLAGKQAVIAACTDSAEYLATVTTEFRAFRTIVGESSVVVDSLADYTDADGEKTTVASCDLYDFDDNMLTAITSYNIELSS